jgi:hypothetical protein
MTACQVERLFSAQIDYIYLHHIPNGFLIAMVEMFPVTPNLHEKSSEMIF